MSIGKVLSEYESNGLPKLPPGFMGTHFIRTDDRIHKILTLETSWKGKLIKQLVITQILTFPWVMPLNRRPQTPEVALSGQISSWTVQFSDPSVKPR